MEKLTDETLLEMTMKHSSRVLEEAIASSSKQLLQESDKPDLYSQPCKAFSLFEDFKNNFGK